MKSKILLYSGGMDSWLINKLWKPDYVFYVDTHSAYSDPEKESLNERVTIVDFFNLREFERVDFIIPYRNVYLCLAALNKFENLDPLESCEEDHREVEICLGATAGDRVLDKSPEFAEKLGDLLTYLSSPQHWTAGKSQSVKIVLPFKGYTKRDLLREYANGDQGKLLKAWNSSFSCYTPTKTVLGYRACGMCKPCFRKTVAFVLEGFTAWPIQMYAKRCREYLEKSGILNEIKAGTYGRAEEESDILKFMEVTKNW